MGRVSLLLDRYGGRMFNDLSHRAQNIRYTSDRTLGKKPKVQRGMRWIQRNGFSYVFLLGILPVGPFVAVNVAAGLARMNLMSYLMAVTLGKGIMVFCVSYIGANLSDFIAEPFKLFGVLAFIVLSLWVSRKLDSYFIRKQSVHDQQAELCRGQEHSPIESR